MGRLRTLLLLATATVVVSTVMVQAAELEIERGAPRSASYYHHHHISGRCDFVQGVRGGNPMTVPFFGRGWSNGTTYLSGWQRCTCCDAAEPVVSVNY
jgi:hypothetical protein